MNDLKTVRDALESIKWKGEPSGNPEKGWVTDSKGNRFTSLGSRNGYGKFLDTHNKQIDYLISTLDRMIETPAQYLQKDVNLVGGVNGCKFEPPAPTIPPQHGVIMPDGYVKAIAPITPAPTEKVDLDLLGNEIMDFLVEKKLLQADGYRNGTVTAILSYLFNTGRLR